MSIDVAGAQAYFAAGNHSKAGIWSRFAPDLQKSGIAEARRVLGRLMKRALVDPTDPADETEFPRDDYAAYEQAIWILENSSIADGSQATAKFIAGRAIPTEARERQRDELAPEAIRWLFRGRIMVSRG